MLKGYAEAIKPERAFFNIMMTAAGLLFATRWHVSWAVTLATIAGTSLLVMSGCLANNITDRRLDATMPRTKKRASASGIISVQVLVLLAAIFGIVGLGILAVWVNVLTALLGVLAYFDYVVLYAWTKRTTPLSTLAGTPAGALPLAAGYTAITGHFNMIALVLSLVMVFWQMVHFYAIGIFRRNDYRAGNLPIWPVRYGVRNTQAWMLVFTLLYIAAIFWLAAIGHTGRIFAVVVGVMGLYWLWLGIKGFRLQEPKKWARGMFGFSLTTLLVFCACLTLSPILV
ncbi:MAG TPA: heme o synthase [Verrucomicrobiae bacterium]|nr:heme o synthase [Verrucomicrobiae bacterium]